jgi:hypothetical protein
MFESAPALQDPAAPEADEAPDPSVVRAERRLRLLEELSEIGMELARALKPGVAACEAAADGKARGRDPADAFAPLSRAIRLTLALEARTDQELRDLKAGIVMKREAERARTAERPPTTGDRESVYRETLRRRVYDAIDAEAESEDIANDLYEALDERLDQDEAYFDCERRPLRETVERLCRDLTLSPDWSRWDGEDWIHDGPPDRPRCSLFHTPSPRPLLDDDGEPRETPAAPRRLQPAHDLE